MDAGLVEELALDLARRSSPAGREGPLASWLASWVSARWARPDGLAVRVQPLGGARANLLIGPEGGPDLAFYGHLDTSLSGDVEVDGPLTGVASAVPEPWVADGVLWGQGMGVAKAPTAAAVVALLELAGQGVGALIAAGGTHRALPPWPGRGVGAAGAEGMGVGVRAALEAGFCPGAVINAKGGAPGPLHEEPGSVYVAITVGDRFGASMARPWSADTLSGPAAHLPAVIESVRRWRAGWLGAARGGQAGREVAIGAVETGLPAKPDLFGNAARLYLYVVTQPGDAEEDVVGSLRSHLVGDAVVAGPAAVETYASLPAGTTPPDHPLMRAVEAAWAERIGPVPDVSGWRGSTDGALLRASGVPTVRVGPPLLTHPDDPRIEGVAIADLMAVADVWVDAARAYLAGLSTPKPT